MAKNRGRSTFLASVSVPGTDTASVPGTDTIFRLLCIGFAALLVAGCQTLAPVRAERFYEGRFALTAVAGEHRDSANGRFRLSVRGDGLTLDLASPFGTTIARIESEPGNARLIVPGNDDASRSDPDGLDALTQRALGWRLPVSGLADWIDGRPARGHGGGTPVSATGDVFVQQGWTINIVERFDGGAPRLLKMDREGDAAGTPTMTIRLVLDHPPTPQPATPAASPAPAPPAG